VSLNPYDLWYPGKGPDLTGPPEEIVLNPPAGKIVRYDYTDGTSAVFLSIKCDNLPHCGSCDCGSGHEYYLDDQIRARIRGVV
jgi:hypothetical protein